MICTLHKLQSTSLTPSSPPAAPLCQWVQSDSLKSVVVLGRKAYCLVSHNSQLSILREERSYESAPILAHELALAQWISAEMDMLMYLHGHMSTELRRCGIVMEAQDNKKVLHRGLLSSLHSVLSSWVHESSLFLSWSYEAGDLHSKDVFSSEDMRNESHSLPSGIRQAAGCSPQIHCSRISQTIFKCQVEEWITAHQ